MFVIKIQRNISRLIKTQTEFFLAQTITPNLTKQSVKFLLQQTVYESITMDLGFLYPCEKYVIFFRIFIFSNNRVIAIFRIFFCVLEWPAAVNAYRCIANDQSVRFCVPGERWLGFTVCETLRHNLTSELLTKPLRQRCLHKN